MSTRRRKIVLGLLIVTAVLVAGVAVVFWKPFGDELSAILGSDDDVLTLPGATTSRVDLASGEIEVAEFAKFLSSWSGKDVIFPSRFAGSPAAKIVVATDMAGITPEMVIGLLRENGWRLRRTELPSGREMYTLEPARR